jgi:hypothetical protein
MFRKLLARVLQPLQVEHPDYRATRRGTGTCLGCGGATVGLRRDCDWWECTYCGQGGEGSNEGYAQLQKIIASTGDSDV